MKSLFTILLISLVAYAAYAQTGNVGVNTTTPKATLDVQGEPTDTSALDGVIVPRIKGNQLNSKTYTIDQKGAMVYVTEAATIANQTRQTINVKEEGQYIFDGTVWIKFSDTNDQEWIYVPSTDRINLVKSGSPTFKDSVYYNNTNGNFRRLGEDEIFSFWDQDKHKDYDLKQFFDTLNSSRTQANARIFRSFNSKNNLGRTNLGKISKIGIKDVFLLDKSDLVNNYISKISVTVVPSENVNDYYSVYNNNSSLSLYGSGNISSSISKWSNIIIGHSQSLSGYATGLLAESSYRGSGSVGKLYSLYARGFNFGGSGTINTSATIRAESSSPIADTNDSTLIKNHYGIYNSVNNSSINTGIGDELAGIRTVISNNGKTKYLDMYGLKSTTNIGPNATQPTNLYGLYFGDAVGAIDNNYAIYTNKGMVSFGDTVGIGTRNPKQMLHVEGNIKAKYIELDAGSVQVFKPVTTGGWARGLNYYENLNVGINEFSAGIGFSGISNTISSIYLGFGNSRGKSVLKSDYDFKSLEEIEIYVKENGHLPGYASAKEIAQKGIIDMTATQLTNVEKIEELYLHTLEQQKKIESQQREINELKTLVLKLLN